jgi:hypothetical protein
LTFLRLGRRRVLSLSLSSPSRSLSLLSLALSLLSFSLSLLSLLTHVSVTSLFHPPPFSSLFLSLNCLLATAMSRRSKGVPPSPPIYSNLCVSARASASCLKLVSKSLKVKCGVVLAGHLKC